MPTLAIDTATETLSVALGEGNHILADAGMKAGRAHLEEEDVDLRQLIAASIRLVSERARSAGITVTVEVPHDLPAIRVDQRRIKQVLLNLLSNAVRFTPSGGEVKVDARVSGNRELVLTVSDTGVGMSQEDIPKALEAFSQIDTPLALRSGSTGLGLSLTRDLVELHGGTLRVRSRPDVGTAVSVHLPAVRVAG